MLNNFDKILFNMNLSEIIIGVNKFNNPTISFEKNDGKFESIQARLDGDRDYHLLSLEEEGDKKISFRNQFCTRIIQNF